MKLFRVEVTKVVYILAEDERQAELSGAGYASDESVEDVLVDEARALDHVDSDWKDSIPYGGDESLTVREWFNKPEEPAPFVDPPEQKRLDFGNGNASPSPA
jgi:hypothetical protein